MRRYVRIITCAVCVRQFSTNGFSSRLEVFMAQFETSKRNFFTFVQLIAASDVGNSEVLNLVSSKCLLPYDPFLLRCGCSASETCVMVKKGLKVCIGG